MQKKNKIIGREFYKSRNISLLKTSLFRGKINFILKNFHSSKFTKDPASKLQILDSISMGRLNTQNLLWKFLEIHVNCPELAQKQTANKLDFQIVHLKDPKMTLIWIAFVIKMMAKPERTVKDFLYSNQI